MYSASANVWNESRTISIRVVLNGTDPDSSSKTITANEIKSFTLDDSLTSDVKFEIGNAAMRTFNFTFYDEAGTVQAIGLGGGTADFYISIDSTETYMGRFYIDEVEINNTEVSCQGVDAMAYAGKLYTPTASFPMTLYALLEDVCLCCNLTLSDLSIQNGSLSVASAPTDKTCREMISYIAQIAGANAKIKRNITKYLTLIYPTDTNEIIPANGTFAIKTAENPVQITGIKFKDELIGTDTYAIELPENPILEGFAAADITSVLTSILANYSAISYYPLSAIINSNPGFESGDIVTTTSADSSTHLTIITHVLQTGLSQCNIVGAGETTQKNNYVGQGRLTARVSEVVSQVSDILTTRLPSLTQAISDATESILSSIQGYIYFPEDGNQYGLATGQEFIMDSEDPLSATNVWRWNMSGLGYSSTGIDGTYELAMTSDGAIVANFITSGTLNAQIIKAGILSDENGISWINLEDGTFSLGGGGLSYDGSTLEISANSMQVNTGNTAVSVATTEDVATSEANVQGQIDNINDTLEEQNAFIRIVPADPSITLGKEGSDANVVITDTEVTINGSDNASAVLASSQLSAPEASFENMYVGHYMWVNRTSNDHLSLKWVNN